MSFGERTKEGLMQWGLREMQRRRLGSGTLLPCDTGSETVLFIVVPRMNQNVLDILSSFVLLATRSIETRASIAKEATAS